MCAGRTKDQHRAIKNSYVPWKSYIQQNQEHNGKPKITISAFPMQTCKKTIFLTRFEHRQLLSTWQLACNPRQLFKVLSKIKLVNDTLGRYC